MSFSLALDVLIAVLLVATIGYAVVLNRRLQEFRKDRAEMEALAKTFAEATAKADASIQKLKGSTNSVAASLEEGLGKAQSLRDDLAFLVDRGTGLADRLEQGIRAARDRTAAPSEPAAKPASAKSAGAAKGGEGPEINDLDAKSEAERELLKALRSVR